MADKLPTNPLVSIVTPVLNGIKYLELCIQSVLNQNYPYIEHIFADGGSTDGTLEMLSSYSAQYPDRIRIVPGHDKGVGEGLNRGLKIAKGEILSWLDSDDLYEPDAIMAVVDFFRSNPGAYFVFGGCDNINETGEIIGKRLIKDFNLREVINDRQYILPCTAFYRREVIERVGLFNTIANDLDFYVRVVNEFQMHRIEKTLSRWRRHKDSYTFSKEAGKMMVSRQKFQEDYLLVRQYGGSFFCPRNRRYFAFLILDKLGLYSLVNFEVLPKLQRYPLMNKLLKLLGA